MDTTLPKKSLTGALWQALFPELCLQCGERISTHESAEELTRSGFFCTACEAAGGLKRIGDVAPENGIQRKFAFEYEGMGKAIFGAAKFSGRRRAINFFIRATREELAALSRGAVLLLALPSRKKFLGKLLKAAVADEKLLLNAYTVKRGRFGHDANKLLGEGERYKRIYESLLWAGKSLPAAERYILCDDVSTTGATLNHAAYLLQKHAGIPKEKISMWALMYRPRHFLIPRQ